MYTHIHIYIDIYVCPGELTRGNSRNAARHRLTVGFFGEAIGLP